MAIKNEKNMKIIFDVDGENMPYVADCTMTFDNVNKCYNYQFDKSNSKNGKKVILEYLLDQLEQEQ